MPKDVQYLSKRRKNQLMNCELHCYKDSLIQSIVRNVALSPVYEAGMTFDNVSCRSVTLLKDQNRFTELSVESQSHVGSTNGHDIELHSSFHEEHDIESCSSFDEERDIESRSSIDDTPTLTDIRDCMDETIFFSDWKVMRSRAPLATKGNDSLIAEILPLRTVEAIRDFEALLHNADEAVTQFVSFTLIC